MKCQVISDIEDGWFIPYANQLVSNLLEFSEASYTDSHEKVVEGDIAFYLSCSSKIPTSTLRKNKNNIVVHASDLPKGKGMSPMTWQIIEGLDKIPLTLFEAVEEIDAGNIYLQDCIEFKGNELIGEMHECLGKKVIGMCLEFARNYPDITHKAITQKGEPSYYKRRTPEDSKIDPHKTLAEQFNLLRVVDNERYPAFFELKDRKYILKIFPEEKASINKRTVLAVVAHSDDEALGCGGTLCRHAAEGDDVYVLTLADGESSRDTSSIKEKIGQRKSAAENAGRIIGAVDVFSEALPDNQLDSIPLLHIAKAIEKHINDIQPDIIYTHHSGDVNIDHCIVQHAVITAARPQPDFCVKQILFFEVPSSTEWMPQGGDQPFVPDWFVDITPYWNKKRELLEAYSNEMRPFPHPRSVEAVEALARWRGSTVGTHMAEAFKLGRNILS